MTALRSFAGAVAIALATSRLAAAPPVWVAKVLRQAPRSEAEMAAAFAASKDACVQVPAGDPLELAEFSGETFYDVTLRVDGQPQRQQRRFEFTRRGVLSFGSAILPEDQQQLPSLSKPRILRRVEGDYVVLQVRLHRDNASGAVYLYHRPLAAVGSFGQPGLAQEFAPVMEDSVRQVRGLGLFVDPDRRHVEEDDLRTLVAVSQSLMVVDGPPQDVPANVAETAATRVGGFDVAPAYRLIFVRARAVGDQFRLHTFVTSKEADTLAYLPAYQSPSRPDDCTVTSEIVFTGYTAAKQSPIAKASRTMTVHDQARYSIADLDAWIAEQGLSGGAFAHLTLALDAIIDGRVGSSPAP